MRATDMPVPYIPCYKGKCRDCKQEVYYSKYGYTKDARIRKIVDAGNLVCFDCATKIVPDEIVITKATMKEAVDYALNKTDSTRVADK